MKTYTEEFATKNFEYIKDFINELKENNIKNIKIEKTGQGWIITWTE